MTRAKSFGSLLFIYGINSLMGTTLCQ